MGVLIGSGITLVQVGLSLFCIAFQVPKGGLLRVFSAPSVRIRSGGFDREWYHFSAGWLVPVLHIVVSGGCVRGNQICRYLQ